MIGLTAEDIADLRRWAISGGIVLFAYGGIAAAMVTWHEPAEGLGAAAGIVIEFAPVPVAPATLQSELPPGPEQDLANSTPSTPVESPEEKQKTDLTLEAKLEQKVEEKVESKPIEEPPPDVKPAPDPEIAIPPPPQEVKQEMPSPQDASVAAIATAPQVIAEQIAETPAAPRPGAPNPFDSAAARTWNAQMLALIQLNKRYPASARSRGEKGVAHVVFNLDRKGRVVDSRVERSSGVAALDEEALALLRRVHFPAPPSELPGDHVTVTLPLRFDLK